MKKGETMHKFKVPVSESKHLGTEPVWASNYEPTDYQSEFGAALNWYSYIVEAKDCRAFLIDWFKTDKDKLKTLSKIPDKLIPRTYANTARIAMRGFPVTDEHKSRIWEKVQETANKRIKLEEDDDTTAEPVIKIAKVLPLAPNFIVSDIDDEIENLIIGEENKTMGQILMPYRMTDKHYLECIAKIEPMLAEFNDLAEARRLPKGQLTPEQQQLLEGYEHLTGMKIVKDIAKLLESYINDLKKSHISKQVAKVKKKKPKDKTKLIKNIKFLQQDDTLGITSVDPINLLNCSEVWTFDTKTRKISKFYSPIGGGITVKGAALIGFQESMSSCKLLRKPDVQLKEFTELKKNDLTKWYSSVKSKDAPVRARLTATTLILKVF
ncbi:MAG: hypothetical protein EBU66_10325 [Bacteroidetes bacterium]|nr:hypothetical protein [bacterium]NBP65036.1 hypothetical protein [Bacteroidota bacterium]